MVQQAAAQPVMHAARQRNPEFVYSIPEFNGKSTKPSLEKKILPK
jgi:hypothetical protein